VTTVRPLLHRHRLPTAVRKLRADFKNNPVGTGPFQFVKWQKDDQITVKRFEGYWGPKAKLGGVIFKVIPDEQTRTWRSRRARPTSSSRPDPRASRCSNRIPASRSSRATSCRWLPQPELRDRPLRQQAPAPGLQPRGEPRRDLQTVYGKLGVAAKLPLPDLLWGYDKKIKDYEYDPAKALALVKAAGVPTR